MRNYVVWRDRNGSLQWCLPTKGIENHLQWSDIVDRLKEHIEKIPLDAKIINAANKDEAMRIFIKLSPPSL